MTDCLVTGAGGALGSVLMRVLSEANKQVVGLVSEHGPAPEVGKVIRANLTDPRSYVDRVFALAPRAIIHLAAIAKPARALDEPELAHAVNVEATATLAQLSTALGARMIFASTDMVFDGEEGAPYRETDTTEPATYYGRTKLEAECYMLTHPRSLTVRLPLLYGFPEVAREATFFETMLRALRAGTPVKLFEDEFRTPLWLEDAARACVTLLHSDVSGVLHLGGPETLSRFQMGQQLAAAIGCSDAALVKTRREDHPSEEPRPRDLSLDSARYIKHFGAAPGHDFRNALPRVLARGPHRLLS